MSQQELSIDEAYTQAIKILADKDTQPAQLGQAIELLQKIRTAGYTSDQLEANLGRAYAKIENWPKAVLHFQEALRTERWDSSLRADLQMAQEKIEASQGMPLSHPAEWGYRIASYFRPQELFAAGFVLMGLAFVWAFYKKGLPLKVWVPICILLVGLFGVAGFSLTGASLATVSSADVVSLRSAPLENAEERVSLKPGARVRILRTSGEFTEIETPTTGPGWVQSSALTPVPL